MGSASVSLRNWRKSAGRRAMGLEITVSKGVVDLNGVIIDEKEREALRVPLENVSGVTAVEDHLVWVESVSGTVIDALQERK
jgi:osmotically-inducible protein OsmY